MIEQGAYVKRLIYGILRDMKNTNIRNKPFENLSQTPLFIEEITAKCSSIDDLVLKKYYLYVMIKK